MAFLDSLDTEPLENFYQKNNRLYHKNNSEETQDKAREAFELGTDLIQRNTSYRNQLTKDPSSNIHLHVSNDTWFWLYLASNPYSSRGGDINCCGGGNCSGGDGEGCLIAILIAAVIALVASAIASASFTGYQGYEAEKIRSKITQFKKELENENTDEHTQDICKKLLPILKDQWVHESTKATFSATMTVGFGFLTAAASIALYAVINHYGTMPHVTKMMAITGGAFLGAGLLGHLIRPLAHQARKKKITALYEELTNALKNSTHVTPITILKADFHEKAYLNFNGKIYVKENEKFRVELSSLKKDDTSYTEIILETQ